MPGIPWHVWLERGRAHKPWVIDACLSGSAERLLGMLAQRGCDAGIADPVKGARVEFLRARGTARP